MCVFVKTILNGVPPSDPPTHWGCSDSRNCHAQKRYRIRYSVMGGGVDMTDSLQVGSKNTPHLRNHLSKLIPVVYICQRRQRQHKNQRLRQPFTTPNPSRATRIPIRWNRLIQVLQLLTAKLPTVNFVWCLTPAAPSASPVSLP